MKLGKRIMRLVPAFLATAALLSGCTVHWDYRTTTKAIDNDYFKTRVVHEDDECMIIENEITGEYFLVVSGGYGVTITPIEMSPMIVELPEWNDDDASASPSMSEESEGN